MIEPNRVQPLAEPLLSLPDDYSRTAGSRPGHLEVHVPGAGGSHGGSRLSSMTNTRYIDELSKRAHIVSFAANLLLLALKVRATAHTSPAY